MPIPHAEELINKAIELAKSGDSHALRLLIERLIPRAKNEALSITLPNLDFKRLESLSTFGAEVISAVTHGDLTLEQGEALLDIAEIQRKSIESAELTARVNEIETILKQRK